MAPRDTVRGGPERRKGALQAGMISLAPVAASILAAGALTLLLPSGTDPLLLVAKILAILVGAGLVLATAEALVDRLRARTAGRGVRWDLVLAGLASAVGSLGVAHAALPSIEGATGIVARGLLLVAVGLFAAHGGVTLIAAAGRVGEGWKARPVQSAAIRATTVLFPILASFSMAVLLDRTLPPPPSTPALVARVVLVLFCSYVTLFLAERLVRRLGPLAMLMKISLAFPDGTPSRYAVARRSRNPHALQEQLEQARRGNDVERARVAETILALATALSAHDSKTRGHAERVRVFTDMLADELRVSRGDRDRLRWVALLHDIGKLTVPRKILNKSGPLDATQWRVIHRHPNEGGRIIAPLAPWLGKWSIAVEQHHEKYDGTGYPLGLSGEEISMGARIIAVADAYDVMTATRSYRVAMTAAAARQEVQRCAGSQFDPTVVRALLNISIRRLWWRMGLASWLAQIPLLGRVPQAVAPVGDLAAAGVRTAAAVAGVAAATALPGAVRQAAPAPPGSEGMIVVAAAVSDTPASPAPGSRGDRPDRAGRGEAPPEPKGGSGGGKKGGKKGGKQGEQGGSGSGGGTSGGGTGSQPPPSGGSDTTSGGGGGTTSDGGGTSSSGGGKPGNGPPPGVNPPGLQGLPPPGLSGGTPPGHLPGRPGTHKG